MHPISNAGCMDMEGGMDAIKWTEIAAPRAYYVLCFNAQMQWIRDHENLFGKDLERPLVIGVLQCCSKCSPSRNLDPVDI
jgi:hypothetical protein